MGGPVGVRLCRSEPMADVLRRKRSLMKILVSSTPANGHINPLLAIANIVMAEGHEVVVLSGTSFRDRIEKSGARFHALPGNADFDARDPFAVAPELKTMAPGLDWMRVALERLFVDRVSDQYRGLLEVLKDFPADVIIGDDMFFGALPMLLGPRNKRPAVVLCGTSFLHWERKDNAPHFVGVPPAATPEEFELCASIAREYDERVNNPVGRKLNQILDGLAVGPLSMTLFDSVVKLADTYMQLTVPGFEFPSEWPSSVRFIGCLPIIPNQAPLPPWADDLDGSRKVVLVTQGTVANHDLGLLVGPTLAALADEPDILVVATAGGRPVEAIPGPIPANARVAEYLPFDWLMKKVDVMVTNGGYGSVNQALSFGVPIVAAGLTEDKADVNVRIAWSGAGINLKTNQPSEEAIRGAVREALDTSRYRDKARRLAAEFATYDTRSEISRVLQVHERAARRLSRHVAA